MSRELLTQAGWSEEPWDEFCWLECSDPAYLKEWHGPDGLVRQIALCEKHALILEHGAFNGEYSGAPLPRDTFCTEWPWRVVEGTVHETG